MLRNSDGCDLPSYFFGTSGLKFFVLGHWTCRSSRVNAGQPTEYGSSPGSPVRACFQRAQRAGLIDAAPLFCARCGFERLLPFVREGLGVGRGEFDDAVE